MAGRHGGGDRGFTLVEVLVAFLIAAAAVAAVVRTVRSATLSARLAGRYDEAVTRAQSHLAALSASPLTDSEREGDEANGFHWRVEVATAATAHHGHRLRAEEGTVTLYRITVTISWQEDGRSRAVQLRSARLGSAA